MATLLRETAGTAGVPPAWSCLLSLQCALRRQEAGWKPAVPEGPTHWASTAKPILGEAFARAPNCGLVLRAG